MDLGEPYSLFPLFCIYCTAGRRRSKRPRRRAGRACHPRQRACRAAWDHAALRQRRRRHPNQGAGFCESTNASHRPGSTQVLQPGPAQQTAQYIVDEIAPDKDRADQHPTQKKASDEFQRRVMDKLENLQQAGNNKDPSGNQAGFGWDEQENQQTPEDDVEYAAQGVVHPTRSRAAGIEFGVEAKRHDHQQRNQGPPLCLIDWIGWAHHDSSTKLTCPIPVYISPGNDEGALVTI
jgi:hypothetical protein